MEEKQFDSEFVDMLIFQMMRIGAIDIRLSSVISATLHNYLIERLNNPKKPYNEIMAREIEEGKIRSA